MKQEGEIAEEVSAAQFRDQFFLHAVASQNVSLYQELYADPDIPEKWEIPQTPEDVQRMMAELAQVGVDLNATPEPPKMSDAELGRQFGVRPPTQPWNAETGS